MVVGATVVVVVVVGATVVVVVVVGATVVVVVVVGATVVAGGLVVAGDLVVAGTSGCEITGLVSLQGPKPQSFQALTAIQYSAPFSNDLIV